MWRKASLTSLPFWDLSLSLLLFSHEKQRRIDSITILIDNTKVGGFDLFGEPGSKPSIFLLSASIAMCGGVSCVNRCPRCGRKEQTPHPTLGERCDLDPWFLDILADVRLRIYTIPRFLEPGLEMLGILRRVTIACLDTHKTAFYYSGDLCSSCAAVNGLVSRRETQG